MKFYPVHGILSKDECKRFNVPLEWKALPNCIKAIITGEKRAPKKGEWYLSGAIPEGYKAHNDLDTPYHICRLVRTKMITTEVIVSE
jgi:hypothetical protein